MTRIAPDAIATVVGVAAGTALGGNPLASAVVTEALKQILADQVEEKTQLDQIKADTQALVRGPYNTGMLLLEEAASPDRNAQDRQESIRKAKDRFLEAHGQEHDDSYYRASIQYQLGNCWALLGSNSDARTWFQRACKSASEAFREISSNAEHAKLRRKLNEMHGVADASEPGPPLLGSRPFLAYAFGGTVAAAGAALVPAAAAVAVVFPPGAALVGPASAVARGGVQQIRYTRLYDAYQRALEDYKKEVAPLYGLMEALERLRKKAPVLALKLDRSLSSAQGV
jgi:tetratricopeptide (TPR) repeat protein